MTVDDFLAYAKTKPNLMRYLPNQRDWHHLDKKWVCDVLYTVETDAVSKLIEDALKKRKDKLEKS